jgi:signal transduction histidine kinase
LRERFTSALAHDLRNPLSIASTASQYLLLKYQYENPEQTRLLHKILESIQRIDEMISNLLDASRIQAGQPLLLVINECDLHEIVEKAVEDLVLVCGDRLILRAHDEVRGFWDGNGMRRVVDNLVINAFKYGSPDMPITVTLGESDDHVRLAVHNYGRPLSEVEKSTLFGLFQRTGAAERGDKQGWGIGLTVVKGIVESQGGRTCVESSTSAGTTFTVTLPRDARPFASQSVKEKQSS